MEITLRMRSGAEGCDPSVCTPPTKAPTYGKLSGFFRVIHAYRTDADNTLSIYPNRAFTLRGMRNYGNLLIYEMIELDAALMDRKKVCGA